MDTGMLGAASGGIEVGAGATAGAFRLDAAASFWPTRSVDTTTPSASGSTTGGKIDLVAGSLGSCFAPPSLAAAVGPRFEIDVPCAGVEIGRMQAEGYGVSDAADAAGLWAAARGGVAGALLANDWLALRLRLEAMVPLHGPRFVLNDDLEVHQPALSGRGTLSIEARP